MAPASNSPPAGGSAGAADPRNGRDFISDPTSAPKRFPSAVEAAKLRSGTPPPLSRLHHPQVAGRRPSRAAEWGHYAAGFTCARIRGVCFGER